MSDARAELALYLGAQANDLVFVPNTTTALNIVARSLPLSTGDEVLASDHEYGALDRTWTYVCRRAGATYVRAPIAVPVTSADDVVEAIWSHVTERTRVLFLSHITSPTAVILPIGKLIERAREAGIVSVIDGAHAPGQIPLDLDALGADVYAGNCHKWMLAPKGSAFLHVRRPLQEMIEPWVVSWGWEPERPVVSPFIDVHEWQGTQDISAYLSVSAAIRFMKDHDWWSVATRCAALLREAESQIRTVTGQPPIVTDTRGFLAQMASFEIPTDDVETLATTLQETDRIEVPVIRWKERTLVRISINAYNDASDVDRFIRALEGFLPAS
jgi:isopenicillin-N epimerase